MPWAPRRELHDLTRAENLRFLAGALPRHARTLSAPASNGRADPLPADPAQQPLSREPVGPDLKALARKGLRSTLADALMTPDATPGPDAATVAAAGLPLVPTPKPEAAARCRS